MIRTNRITISETPPDSELEYLASIFERINIEYDPQCFRKFIIRKKDGSKAEFYSHFVNLHKVLQSNPELDHPKFIRAQFYFNNTAIHPWQLLNRLSLIRYYNFLDLDVSRNKLEQDYEFVLKSDAQYIEQFCREDGIEFSLANYFDSKDRNGNFVFPFEYEFNKAPSIYTFANSRTYNSIRGAFLVFKNLPGDTELAKAKETYLLYPKLIQVFKDKFGEKESLL